MNLLVDALSVNNLSGAYVLRGHLVELLAARKSISLTLITHQRNTHVATGLERGIHHVVANVGSGWLARAAWCRLRMRGLCSELEIDCVLSPAGLMTPGCPVPQVVLAQNPWPLVGKVKGLEGLRLKLQAHAFGRAQRMAAVMAFNSHYMKELYAERFGPAKGRSLVAYQGLSEAHFGAARSSLPVAERRPVVLAVSVMARHKNIESLVAAFSRVATEVPAARLVIAGGWPDPVYRGEVDEQIRVLGLQDRVEILGHVADTALHELFGSSRIFCLLSRCESFGIPALEAQAFATPCVVSEGTAAPEVIGGGGRVVPQDAPGEVARILAELLSDDAEWLKLSAGAVSNVERFRWSDCSRPLIESLDELMRGKLARSRS